VDLPGDADGVAALFLGDGDGDGVGGFAGGEAADIRQGRGGGSGGEAGVGIHLVGAVNDVGDVAQIDGAVLMHADHQAADFVGVVQEGAGLDGDFAVDLGEGTGRGLGVGHFERAGDFHGGEPVSGEAFAVELDADDPFLAAVDGDSGAVGDPLELVGDDLGDAEQLVGAVSAAVQGDVHDRDIVDLDGLDDPAGDAGRGLINVLENLVVDLDQAVLAVLADEKAHGDDGQARAGHGVDVFHAVNLIEHFFEAGGDQLLDLGGGAAGHHDHDVGQRYDDLGVFLARGDQEGGDADRQADENQKDGQVALQEGLEDAGGDGTFAFIHHGSALLDGVEKDDVAGGEAGEDFDGVATGGSGFHEAAHRAAVADGVDELKLADADDGGGGNDDGLVRPGFDPEAAESAWQDIAGDAFGMDLHELSAAGGVDFADDFRNRALEDSRRAFEGDFDGLAKGQAVDQAHGHWSFEAHTGGVVDGQQRHARIGEVAGFDAAVGHDAVDGRGHLGIGQHDLDLLDLGLRGIEHGFGGGHGLLGSGFLIKEAFGAVVFCAGLVELGLGGGELLADIAVIQRHQHLAFHYTVAGGGEDFADIGRDAGAEVDLFLGSRGAHYIYAGQNGLDLDLKRLGVPGQGHARFRFQLAGAGLVAQKSAGPDDDDCEADEAEKSL